MSASAPATHRGRARIIVPSFIARAQRNHGRHGAVAVPVPAAAHIMKIFRGSDSPFQQADARSFTGTAETRLLGSSDEGTPAHIYEVVFEPGARTNWHRHTGPQWLLVIEGRIRIQCENGTAEDLDEGDAVVIAPGERHWHGATPGGRGAHFAVNVRATTEWLEPVSDEDYSR